MGNTDSIPVVSQVKSLVQYVAGDPAGALHTQESFAYNNTFPIVSQIASAGYAIGGDPGKAKDLQEQFAKDMEKVISTIPVAGHVEGGVYYALGDKKKGEEAMKAASRSTGVALGGVGGFFVGGPVGAAAGGVAGGAAADGIITGVDTLVKGKENAQDSGYIAMGKHIKDAVEGKTKIKVDEAFDMAMLPLADGIGGAVSGDIAGNIAGGLKPGEVIGHAVDEVKVKPASAIDANGNAAVIDKVPQIAKMDKAALDNRANQLNPNNPASGPGRSVRYRGKGTKADLDNRANQLNPNNKAYAASRLEQEKTNPAAAATINANPAQQTLKKTNDDKMSKTKSGEDASGPSALKTVGNAAAAGGSFLMSVFGGVWQLLLVLLTIAAAILGIIGSVTGCICSRLGGRRRRDYESVLTNESRSGDDEALIAPVRNGGGYGSLDVPV